MAMPDGTFGIPITEGDLLLAASVIPAPGPLPVPVIAVFGGPLAPAPDLGLPAYPFAVGHVPGDPGFVEVDALSFGQDYRLVDPPTDLWVWSFSVDEFAMGIPAGPAPPDVFTEGAAGFMEASADIFVTFPPGAMPPGPLAPGAVPAPWNANWIDGDGLAPPFGLHPSMPFIAGLGLVEPNPPTFGAVPDPGDNLDAMDVDITPVGPGTAPFPIYFSLDAEFPDFLEPFPPVNSGSALANGFVGGDVLVVFSPGAPPMVYAAASTLGLDFFGPDTDDLDALVLAENGVPGYQPSTMPFPPYDWGPGGADMLMFSVRRGSLIVGISDGIFGFPIEEGDILVPPLVVGGPPGVFIAAENLGLLTCRTHGVCPGDELDALDLSSDCQGNGLPDVADVYFGIEPDCNGNLIPDSCEAFPSAETPGVDCADGLDNNCDGLIDCADPDCASDPFCGGFPCGNGTCEGVFGENPCTCAVDCGPLTSEDTDALCQDGFDNDCNGLTDCDEFTCCGAPGCIGVPETRCCDGSDNDCDGCTDGDDSDCGGTESQFGLCADGVDNDCDGFVDCADPDCATDPACGAASCGNGICEGGLGEDPCTCPPDCGGIGPEIPGLTCLDGIDNDCNGLADCDDPACCGAFGCIGVPESVCCDAEDNDCDGCFDFDDSDCGGIEWSCVDGADNDCDGLIDCSDPDCAVSLACSPSCGDGLCDSSIGENPCTCPADCGGPGPELPGAACVDGIDNDCDGLIDCDDPGSCCFETACAGVGEMRCSDGLDNDCDGCTDGTDSDCGGTESSCTDGIDNDCDGDVDCADADCAGNPACVSCTTHLNCEDAYVCTCDECVGGTCVFSPIRYGDIAPPPCGNGIVDVDDILEMLAAFANGYALHPWADIAPPCTGNQVIDVDDILGILMAFSGVGACGC